MLGLGLKLVIFRCLSELHAALHTACTNDLLFPAYADRCLQFDIIYVIPPGPTHVASGTLYDVETTTRHRHLHMLVNPELGATLRLRARVIQSMRAFFVDRGFVEVLHS